MATEDRVHRAQLRLKALLADVEGLDRELAEIRDEVPELDGEEAEAMERGAKPRSLGHFVGSMIECMRSDDLRPLMEDVKRTAEMTAEELERRWEPR
jgi:hypothetical protein